MPNNQPNVATGDGRVPTKKSKTKKPAKTGRPKPSAGGSPAKGGYDWGDGKGKIHSIPLTEHKRNVEARGYGLQLELYALAAARILGVDEVDATLFFTASGMAVDRRFGRAELEPVGASLAADLEKIARWE